MSMMRLPLLRAAFVIAAAAGSTACAPFLMPYPSPKIDEPHAVLILRQTEAIAPGSIGMSTFIATTTDISQANSSTIFPQVTLWGRNEEGQLRIATGHPLYLQVIATLPGGTCSNYVTFTPDTGATYRLEQPTKGVECRIRLRDLSTDRTPPGARYFQPTGWSGASADRAPDMYEGPLED